MLIKLSLVLSLKKAYISWLGSSLYVPIMFPAVTACPKPKALLPKTFSNEPILSDSDLPTDIFCASLYSPLGISLLSRSLFILDLRKLFLISAIFKI